MGGCPAARSLALRTASSVVRSRCHRTQHRREVGSYRTHGGNCLTGGLGVGFLEQREQRQQVAVDRGEGRLRACAAATPAASHRAGRRSRR